MKQRNLNHDIHHCRIVDVLFRGHYRQFLTAISTTDNNLLYHGTCSIKTKNRKFVYDHFDMFYISIYFDIFRYFVLRAIGSRPIF